MILFFSQSSALTACDPFAVHTRRLRLIAAETIVEVLSLVLVPLAVGTLVAATISAGTLRAAITHGGATVSCRRGGLRAAKVALLSVVLSYNWVVMLVSWFFKTNRHHHHHRC